MVLSCEKASLPLEGPKYGEVDALLNGTEWDGNILGLEHKTYYSTELFLDLHIDWDIEFNETSINFGKIDPDRIGDTMRVEARDSVERDDFTQVSSSFYTSLGDVLLDKFIVYGEADNYFIVTDWDEESRELQGRFHATYVRDFGWKDTAMAPWMPDTVVFTDGIFRAEVIDYP